MYLTYHLILGSIRDSNFFREDFGRHFSVFVSCCEIPSDLSDCGSWTGEQRLKLRLKLRLLSGSYEGGKGRGKWTLRNKVAALLLWWSKWKEKRRERARNENNRAVVCVCLDVEMQGNCKSQRNTQLQCLALMLRSWDIKIKLISLQIKRT